MSCSAGRVENRLPWGVADFDHLESDLRRAAVRAAPIFLDIRPPCAGRNPMFWQTKGLVVGKAAAQAEPAFEGISGHPNLHQSGWGYVVVTSGAPQRHAWKADLWNDVIGRPRSSDSPVHCRIVLFDRRVPVHHGCFGLFVG